MCWKSVRRSGNRVKVTVQLIDPRDALYLSGRLLTTPVASDSVHSSVGVQGLGYVSGIRCAMSSGSAADWRPGPL